MSTITINTFLTDTVSREELVQAISRLPAGSNTRTEIIDDETGEVLYTCQRWQVQMAVDILSDILGKKCDKTPDNDEATEDADDKDTQPKSIVIAGTTFTIGDRVQAKRDDERDNCYQEKDRGVLVNIDEPDDTYPLCVRFDKDHVEWVHAEDFAVISK